MMQGGPGTDRPGQINCTGCPLQILIGMAYELEPVQITYRAPLPFQTYDIVAKVPAGSSRRQAGLMMQQLLAERFQLRVHREKKDTEVYALIVGKQGPKLQQSQNSAVEQEPPIFEAPMLNPLGGDNLVTLTGKRTSMKQLADALSPYVHRQVVDMTGLKGGYDFSLCWVANENLPLPKESDLPPGITFAPHYPQDAVQIQLGLKLEPRKMPVDIVVVDAALKVPIEN
jgi:uncharacterized protein (TIGR03435 family)